MRLIDVSFPLRVGMAIYPGNPVFSIDKAKSLVCGDSADVSEIIMGSHTGTHIDVPGHIIPNGPMLEQIPLERMNGMAKILDLSGRKIIEPKDFEKYGIEKDDIILMKTDNTNTFSCDTILADYVTLSYNAAWYLARKKIRLVGIDYMSIERPRGTREMGKSIHEILLGANVLVCEALNLKGVPEGTYRFYCFPINIIGADGCPVRAVIEKP